MVEKFFHHGGVSTFSMVEFQLLYGAFFMAAAGFLLSRILFSGASTADGGVSVKKV